MGLNLNSRYSCLSDREVVKLIIEGNNEALLYLLYDRYAKDLRYYAMRYYNSLTYLDELTDELYLKLIGKNSDKRPLISFQWRCSFRTWFCSVASHLFYEKRKELIGINENNVSIDRPNRKECLPPDLSSDDVNPKLVMVMEAISRLENMDYRFILIKELEGYTAQEMTLMLTEKRKQENRLSVRKGNVVIPTVEYIYMIKARALQEVKTIVKQIDMDWHGNK